MADVLQTAYDFFWSESFWLPNNYSWIQLKNKDDGIYRAQFRDLHVAIYLAVIISAIRIFFERCIFGPIGHSYGLKSVVKKASPNPVLEKAFKEKKSPSNDSIQKSWFYETKFCWRGWPHHHVPTDVYWYYMVEFGFYLSLLASLFTDNKRKDFTEMIVHHIATLLLMGMSWANNFVRIGTLVLLVHDAVDSWMEAAKVAKYLKFDGICNVLFLIFMIVWVLTRMMLFPFRIIHSTMFEASAEMDPEVGWLTMYSVYNILLCTLQVLHIIWFYYICLIAADAFKGQVKQDSRSSLESESESEGEDADGHKPVTRSATKDKQSANGTVRSRDSTKRASN
ncbi:ceramide synthase 2 [Elysia marginata]|uniref:Ceramide synthase 2 n=1 Tax=Elysia marginata TaxID=1093978 RepID=A0AAV4IMX4_9GAST|nr:ceramide synthase 2 [Elysia marginata]